MPGFKKKTWEKPSVRSFGSAEEVRAYYASRGTAAERAALDRILAHNEGEGEDAELARKDIRRRRYG